MSSDFPQSNEAYSSLELDLRGTDTQKESVIPRRNEDTHKEYFGPQVQAKQDPAYIVIPPTQEDVSRNTERTQNICGLRRRIFWAIVAISAVCIIVAAVVGGVVGSRNNEKGDGITETSTETTTPDSSSSAKKSSSLASLTFYDSNKVNQRRLFYQSSDNVINEYSWNSTSRKWYHMSRLGGARKNSPIAASVSYGSYPYHMTVYFIMEGNIIGELYNKQYNKTTSDKWLQGDLGSINAGVLEDTDLAAAWNRNSGCDNCDGNIHVVYQDPQGDLSLGNGTGGGWDFTRPPVPDSASGTPLSYLKSWLSDNDTTDMFLFYDQKDSNVTAATWGQASQNKIQTSNEWEVSETDFLPSSTDSSFASFSFTPPRVNNEDRFYSLLVSNEDGVTAFVMPDGQTEWTSTKVDVMDTLDKNTKLAANSDGYAYGIENGVIKEFVCSSQGMKWAAVGDVLEL